MGLFRSKVLCGLILLSALLGCRTPPPIPQVNLMEPGWNVRHGQAIWRPQRDAPEIAGELLVATHTNHSALVQFIKSPFPMVNAQQTPTSWRIEFAGGNKKYGGPGKPPRRLLWFWLLPALSKDSLPKNWLWHENKNRWHLENSATGEFLEGYFQQPATFFPAPQIFPGASRKLSMNRTKLRKVLECGCEERAAALANKSTVVSARIHDRNVSHDQ